MDKFVFVCCGSSQLCKVVGYFMHPYILFFSNLTCIPWKRINIWHFAPLGFSPLERSPFPTPHVYTFIFYSAIDINNTRHISFPHILQVTYAHTFCQLKCSIHINNTTYRIHVCVILSPPHVYTLSSPTWLLIKVKEINTNTLCCPSYKNVSKNLI